MHIGRADGAKEQAGKGRNAPNMSYVEVLRSNYPVHTHAAGSKA